MALNRINKVDFIGDRNFMLRRQTPADEGPGFANTLHDVLGKVNRLQVEADLATEELLTGNLESLHQVMIKAEEAQLSLQFTVQVVSKVLQAYQEIARMQI